jgi:hypothetical protein
MNISKAVKILLRNPKLVMIRKKDLKNDPMYLHLELDENCKFNLKMIADYFGSMTHIITPVVLSVSEITANDWIIIDLDKRGIEYTETTKCKDCHAYCELNNNQGFCSHHNFIMDQNNEDDERCYKLKPVIKDKFWEDE